MRMGKAVFEELEMWWETPRESLGAGEETLFVTACK
jgi:hypothetical protein